MAIDLTDVRVYLKMYERGEITIAEIAKAYKVNIHDVAKLARYLYGAKEWNRLVNKRSMRRIDGAAAADLLEGVPEIPGDSGES